MKRLTFLGLVVFALCGFSFPAFAEEPVVCITDITYGDGVSPMMSVFTGQEGGGAPFRLYNASFEAPSCREVDSILQGLTAFQLTLGVANVGSICMGNVPAVVGFTSASVGIGFIKFILDNMPCKPSQSDQQAKRMVAETVCQVLEQKGMECRPEDMYLE